MDQAKPCLTPMEISDLSGDDDDREFESCVLYQAAVGSLQYLSNGTRPDITFAVNSVSKYLKSPKNQALEYGQAHLSLSCGHNGLRYSVPCG